MRQEGRHCYQKMAGLLMWQCRDATWQVVNAVQPVVSLCRPIVTRLRDV